MGLCIKCTCLPLYECPRILYYCITPYLKLSLVPHENTLTFAVPVPPAITSWNNSVRVRSGEELTLSCEAAGDPPPTITWTHYLSGKVFTIEIHI
jgi:hypothetical protein